MKLQLQEMLTRTIGSKITNKTIPSIKVLLLISIGQIEVVEGSEGFERTSILLGLVMNKNDLQELSTLESDWDRGASVFLENCFECSTIHINELHSF